jgi:class 3 adenylate cyclase/tetratricopeptide (TPR) repeat protein
VRILGRVARLALPPAGTFPASERLKPYVSRLAIEWLREEPDRRHRSIDGTLVFADISGFTSLTERLSRKGKVGAEEMNDLLDSVFTELLSVAYDYGASVIKWGGDATLLLFTGDDHPAHACRAAVEMQRTMRSVGRLGTSAGRVTLRMSVGIHSGLFDFFFVGKLHRELVVAGPAANETVEAESVSEAGEIVISAATAAALETALVGPARAPGFLLARAPKLEVDRTPGVGDVHDIDLVRCVPAAISGHLIEGGGEAEHRPLTIAFIQFAGTDELLAAEGPEAVADALEHCIDTVEGLALERKVAFFDTDIAAGGGKMLLVSGAPTSSGNDEERMLRALRAIADAGPALPLQIGVNRGRIFAADFGPPYRRTYSFKGDAANLAARLMAKSAPGQILATDDVLTRSRTEFDAEPLEPFEVKGKSAPVQAYALGPAKGMRTHYAEAPLVGREEELRILLVAVESARQYDGRIVEIVGDPGIGKSRLIQELGEAVEPDVFTSIQCDEYEATTPYHPFQLLLRSLLAPAGADDVAPGRLRQQMKRTAPHLLPWLPLLAVPLGLELPDTPETAPLEGEFRKNRLEEVVAELLGMLLLQPTVIVFEDVHWVDEASAGLLAHLARTLTARPWLVVATRRDRPTMFSVPADADPQQIWLKPLSADAAAELIERSLAELPLAQRHADELAARAGGNPLFLTELLAAAQREEGLEELPDSVEALMIREIDRLSPPARRMLRSAAVIGATFGLDLLRTCLGEPWQDETWKTLEEFVIPQDGDAYRFRHMMARDTAYEGLPYRRRRDLHARVGEELERRAGPHADDEAGLLSLHFFHAHRFDAAWRYSRMAAAHAQGIWANVDAGAFYERALASARHLQTVDRAERAAVTESLGDVRYRAGDYPRAEAAFREGRRLLAGDVLAQARILLKQAALPETVGRYVQAIRWLQRAERLLDGEGSVEAGRLRAQIYAWRGAVRNFQGRFRDGIVSCLRAIEEAERSGERRALAHAYYILDWAYVALGSPDQATYSPRALEIYEELGDLPRQADVLNNLGAFAYLEGRWNDALDSYERGRELRERIGDPVHAANGTLNIAEIFTDQGRLEEAERLARDALRVWRAAGATYSVGFATRQLGRVAARSGRHQEALEQLEQARTLFLEAGAPSDVNETDAARAECLVLSGRPAEALELVAPSIGRAEKTGGFELPQLKRVQAYALLQLGDLDKARAAFEESLDVARLRGADYEAALGLAGLAHLRRLSGEDVGDLDRERESILENLGVMEVLAVPRLTAAARP